MSVVDRLREELLEIGARLEHLAVLVSVSETSVERAAEELAELEQWRQALSARVTLLEQARSS